MLWQSIALFLGIESAKMEEKKRKNIFNCLKFPELKYKADQNDWLLDYEWPNISTLQRLPFTLSVNASK